MKNKIIIIGISLITLVSCNKEEVRPERQDLQIRFENIGDSKIKNFKFEGKRIGNIQRNSVTRYYSFDQIQHYDNYIQAEASVNSDYGTVEHWNNNATEGLKTISSGKHTIQLSLMYGCGVGFMLQLKK